MELNMSQLRQLGDQLNFKFERSIKKGALRSQIITHLGLIPNLNSLKVSGKGKRPQAWSPPEIQRNCIPNEKNKYG